MQTRMVYEGARQSMAPRLGTQSFIGCVQVHMPLCPPNRSPEPQHSRADLPLVLTDGDAANPRSAMNVDMHGTYFNSTIGQKYHDVTAPAELQEHGSGLDCEYKGRDCVIF